MSAKYRSHHLHRKPVDTGGDRRVGGEHRAGANHGQRGVEIQPGIDQFADALGAEESGVAFVHVEHLGRRQPFDGRERPDGSHPADAGQDLLLHAMLLVAAVETVGDPAQFVLVLRNVGVQQQQRNATDLGHPHLRMQPAGSPAGPAQPAPARRHRR